LKPIPTLLRIAYEQKRILLIRWSRPHLLEDFLVPPEGGFDWRVPPEMVEVMSNSSYGKRLTPIRVIKEYARGGMALIRTRYQTSTPDKVYDEMVAQDQNETLPDYALRKAVELQPQPDFNHIYHKVWRIFFTPAPKVAIIIKKKLDDMGLIPNHYVSAHLRALYAVDAHERPDWYIHMFTENALACATQLKQGTSIFFASDSSVATEYALKLGREKLINSTHSHYVADQKSVPEALAKGVVVSIPNPNPPWHLDSMLGPVEKFYDTFVDLYLMALAGCVTYGKGGYGHWASLIGGNADCALKQAPMGQSNYVKNPCRFTPPGDPTAKEYYHNPFSKGTDSLLLPPMTTSINR
jgi:hypothetical protein